MRYIILSVFLFGSYVGNAQTNLNDYKYIVVPKKFEEFKKENQYQTNTLVKHLFTQKGFSTLWEDNLPDDVVNNSSQALFVTLRNKSSMFKTKTTIVLSDRNKQEIFTTDEGDSKQKDYKLSYTEAITDAMKSFDGLQYEYNGGSEVNEPITVSFKNDVKNIDEAEKTSVKSKNQDDTVVVQEATTNRQTYKDKQPKESDYKKAKESIPVVEQKIKIEEKSSKAAEPVSADIEMAESKIEQTSSTIKSTDKAGVLYAQELANGYQLVDSTPKIQLKLRKTSMPSYYLAEGNGKSGVVYEKSGNWYFEYYSGDQLMVDELNIKF